MSGDETSWSEQLEQFMQSGFDLALQMERVATRLVSQGTDAVYGASRSSTPATPQEGRSTTDPSASSGSGRKPRGGQPADDQTSDVAGIASLAADLVGAMLKFTTTVVSQVASEATQSAGDARDSVAKHPKFGGLVTTVSDQISTVVGAAFPSTGAGPSPLLSLPDASPGQVSAVHVVVRNDTDRTFDVVRLRSSAFVGVNGSSIPGHLVKFSPASVTVGPHEKSTVTCTLPVPHDAVRGRYCAVIDAVDIVGVRLLAELDVV